MQQYQVDGQEFYLRVDALELAESSKENSKGPSHKKRTFLIVILSAVIVIMSVISAIILLVFILNPLGRKRAAREGQRKKQSYPEVPLTDPKRRFIDCEDPHNANVCEERVNINLTFFYLHTIAAATDNFSPAKKLGQGGFGPVYKGELSSGQEIAIKRLSKNSGQGMVEFKNEVCLIAKLQHRNLVRLLGCCIEEEERMLIYEYMPNRSLDSFIFDESKKEMLNWDKRFEIIIGIARGILYLHQDSRLRIIHRDLKSSNILLDGDMNPKISDFGTARIFGGNQSRANTRRVVGTFGYMSPEYALDGLFSTKSDVFSFGVVLLEIISGQKNVGFFQDDANSNLIGHVWNLWENGKALLAVDSSFRDSCRVPAVLRCIQVGLLCVQDSAEDRPTMSTVTSMLSNEIVLPTPKHPTFATMRKHSNIDPISASIETNSSPVNEVTYVRCSISLLTFLVSVTNTCTVSAVPKTDMLYVCASFSQLLAAAHIRDGFKWKMKILNHEETSNRARRYKTRAVSITSDAESSCIGRL